MCLKDVAATRDESSPACIKSVAACYQLYTRARKSLIKSLKEFWLKKSCCDLQVSSYKILILIENRTLLASVFAWQSLHNACARVQTHILRGANEEQTSLGY